MMALVRRRRRWKEEGWEGRHCKCFSAVFCDSAGVHFYPSSLLLLDHSYVVSFTSGIAVCTSSA